jgi:hypothetical protein
MSEDSKGPKGYSIAVHMTTRVESQREGCSTGLPREVASGLWRVESCDVSPIIRIPWPCRPFPAAILYTVRGYVRGRASCYSRYSLLYRRLSVHSRKQ